MLVACNAATSAALPQLQEELEVPVVGVITPEAHAAVQATRNRRIGLLATQATVEAGRYAELVHALDAGAELVPVACPRLVPLIESDDPFAAETTEAVREYAAPLKEAGVDTVILGCTHYPLIRPIFQRVFGRGVTLVFSAEETAREVAETLARKGIENEERREGSYRFLTTGDPDAFRALGERFLQLPLGEVEHVALADLEASHERTTAAGPTSCARSSSWSTTSSSRTGAVLYSQGKTSVLCTASLDEGVPRWMRGPGPRLADRRVLAAAGLDRRPHAARGERGQAEGPHRRDPAADRPGAARGARLRGARRADALARLRRAPGRRRHPLRGDLGRLGRGARARSTRRASRARCRTRSRRSRSGSSAASCCSTSTTSRTRAPRST